MNVNKSEYNRLKELYFQMTKERGKPLDFWEVAALLEVYGVRDIDAKNEYGFENVFEMAKYLFEHFRESKQYGVKRLVEAEELPPLKQRVIKNFFRGLAFAMPMLLQIFFTIVFGFALWSNVHLDVTDATVMALGTFLALVVSGGSAQIIGRKGLYYLKMNEKILSGKIMQVLLWQSFAKILLIAFFFFVANAIFYIFSDYLLYLFLATFVLLSMLFTISSVYYVFEEYDKIFYFYFIGILFVFLFHYLFGIGFPNAQFLAILLLNVVFFLFAWRKTEALKKSEESEGAILPRVSMLIYTLLPFYVYGVLYFIFLVMDRMIAWNANSVDRGYFVWFDVSYEIGSDLALLVLILAMGFVEIAVYEFLYKLNDEIFKYTLDQYSKFNEKIQNFFARLTKFFIFYLIGTIIFVSVLVVLLKLFGNAQNLPLNANALFVFFMASVAFGFLAFGLFNTLILFSFSRQGVVVKAIALAIGVDFLVGIILANMVSIYFAVLGLLTGSAVFWWITYDYLQKVLKKLDYYYYSAF